MKIYRYITLILAVALITSCNEDDSTEPTVPSGLIYTYFPAKPGDSLMYDVELITKDEFTGVHDTDYYQLLEVVDSVITDLEGRPTNSLSRYTRPTSGDPWLISDVWTSNLTNSWAEKKEENVIFVKLAFPIGPDMNWNGNVKNTMPTQIYRYRDIHDPLTVGSLSFDSTLTVQQIDEDYFTEYHYALEKYANHVGMIYKEQIDIVKDNSIPGQVGIKSQRKYKETLIWHSN